MIGLNCRLYPVLVTNLAIFAFREEESLIDIFTFEIMVNFVESLALAHHDDKSMGMTVLNLVNNTFY